jgi:xanthine dehydrogenase YagS FAD-binding subunit
MSLRFMPKFEHYNATTIQEACEILNKNAGNAKVIAGGTALLDILKKRYLTAPKAIVNLKTIPDLTGISSEGGGVKIGPMTTLTEIAESSTVPMLAETAKQVSTPQLRNMGTIGGNICQQVRCWYYNKAEFYCYRKGGPVCYQPGGDNRYGAILEQKVCNAVVPSDMAVSLTALNATLTVQGMGGTNEVAMKDFYVTLGNVLKPDEIITSINIPETPSRGSFKKAKVRRSWDFAIASAAVATTSQGTTAALGGVAPVIVSGTPDEVSAALDNATPLSMNRYKIQIAKTMLNEAMA